MDAPRNIVVNDFMFCADHGDEYCHACCCDHRLTNNIRIEDVLQDDSRFDFEHDLEERQSINAYALGAVAAIQTEDSFECEKHSTVDCERCFDWVEIVTKHAEDVEELGRWNLGSARHSLDLESAANLSSSLAEKLKLQGDESTLTS